MAQPAKRDVRTHEPKSDRGIRSKSADGTLIPSKQPATEKPKGSKGLSVREAAIAAEKRFKETMKLLS